MSVSKKPLVLLSLLTVTMLAVIGKLIPCHAADESPEQNWIKSGAVEIKVNEKLILSNDSEIQEVRLGELQLNKLYYLKVLFVNTLDRAVKIASIRSGCGCLSAINQAEIIDRNAESYFLVQIAKQQLASKFEKNFVVSFDNNSPLSILISATFIAPFELQTNRIQLTKDTTDFELRFTPTKFAPTPPFSIRSSSGFTRVRSQTRNERGDLVVVCEVLEKTYSYLASSRSLSERLEFVSSEVEGAVILDAIIGRDSHDTFVCKPSRVKMKKVANEYVGRLIVFGDWETVIRSGQSPSISLQGKEFGIADEQNSVAITRYSKQVAIFEIRSHKPKDEKHALDLIVDGRRLCEFDGFYYEEEN